jgi:cold shock CspA family protein
MQVPLELSFRDVQKTDDIESLINSKVDDLERICDNIISCRMAVEKPQEHQKSGNPYRVRINLRIPPGKEIVITRNSGEGDMHAPLEAIIRDAFSTASRELQELMDRLRQDVKQHPDQEMSAIVEEVNPDEDYGFLRSLEGRRIYFHANSVLNNDFDRVEVGTGVRFVSELGDKGMQATTVQIVNKPGSGRNKS